MPLEGATREDTWDVEVTVIHNGIRYDLGTFDSRSGGEVDSSEFTFQPGNMQPPVSLGGSRTTGNLILTRNYRLGRDHQISQLYIDWAGRADVECMAQPLDHNGKPWGKPITWKGTFKRATFPPHDSTTNNAAMLEIEVTAEGYPTGMAP